jgi:hypothetical protein
VVVQEEVDHLLMVLVVDVLNVLINLKAKVHLQQMNQVHLNKVEILGVMKQVLVVVEVEVDQDVVILKEVVVLVAEVVVDVEISIIEIKKKVHNKKIMVGNKVRSTLNFYEISLFN